MLGPLGRAPPERRSFRGEPCLAIPAGGTPDVAAAHPAVLLCVPPWETEREIDSGDQPIRTAPQPEQFVADLHPRPAVLKEAERSIHDGGHPRGLAPVVGAPRPIDGDDCEVRHGGIVALPTRPSVHPWMNLRCCPSAPV